MCTLPGGHGQFNAVVMTVNGQSSNSFNFVYNGPRISKITPANGYTSGGQYITIGALPLCS